MYLNIPGIMKVTCGERTTQRHGLQLKAQVFIVIRHVLQTKSFALVI